MNDPNPAPQMDPNPNPATPAQTPPSTGTPTQEEATPAAAPEATPDPATNGNPSPSPDVAAIWGGDLDDDVKQFVGNKTPAQVAKELFGAQKLIGKKVIGVPDANATPEEHRAFHAARGVPDSPDKYELSDIVEKVRTENPEIPYDEDREKMFRELARSSNLSNAEAREFLGKYLEQEIAQNKEAIIAAQNAEKQARDMLVQNWGPDFAAKEVNANKFARSMGLTDADFQVFLKAPGTTPQARYNLVNFMAEQGALLQENPGGGGHELRSGANMSPDEARQQKEAYLARGDNRQAYNDSSHPRHKEVEAQMTIFLKAERGLR